MEPLNIRERLILRLILFTVNWLSRGCKDIHTFEIDKLMEEYGIKKEK